MEYQSKRQPHANLSARLGIVSSSLIPTFWISNETDGWYTTFLFLKGIYRKMRVLEL